MREAFANLRFRRQHPIGDRIADFSCPARKLVIELDGGRHESQSVRDQHRMEELAQYGYRVVRFWNNDVQDNLAGVLEAIRLELERSPPHPALSAPGGQRGN
ncbi:MAG TPA: endonuclease domain-containing protein [Magnetospirillaceae bacterium]